MRRWEIIWIQHLSPKSKRLGISRLHIQKTNFVLSDRLGLLVSTAIVIVTTDEQDLAKIVFT